MIVGYDDNDLDLDLFCREVVHADIEHIKLTPNRNVVLGLHHINGTIWIDEVAEDDRMVKKGSVEQTFGQLVVMGKKILDI